MDGQILGYDSEKGEGAIRSEAGDRYGFKREDWKGDREPKQGDKVDFVAGTDGKATEIYIMKAAFTGPDLSGIGNRIGDSKSRAEMLSAARDNQYVGLFITKPHVAGAGLVILGWLFTGHLLLITHLADLHDGMNQISRFMNGGFAPFRFLGVWIMLGLYLIPVFSGWLIYKALLNTEAAKNKRQAALSALLLPIVLPIIAFILILLGLPGDLRNLILEAGSRTYGQASEFDFWSLIDIDFGWSLMIAGAILILLQMMGIVKSFGGSPKAG